MKHLTCYKCLPPRHGKHYFIGGKPVHIRKDCPSGIIYFLDESMFDSIAGFTSLIYERPGKNIPWKLNGEKKKGGRTHMMKKKGMTKNQKLKMLKTSAAKKKVKATKK